ncbi:uncharacterized protein [Haliotis cracherodii]|uniref:uncharacterized protein n=1 Tax=Haliotis cracherodii TaxID=6455 RepID=UPI0039E76CD8
MKNVQFGRNSNLETEFRLFLKRILRQTQDPGNLNSRNSNTDSLSGLESTKFLMVNSSSGSGYDNSLTILSMVAPSSTLSTNTTDESGPSDYLHSRSITTISRHSSLVAVMVIMSLFLIITISTTGLLLAFCKKKNTVFALQKCEQDSEYELDDMEQTDIEMCDDSEISPKTNKVRSRTCPTFNNITDSDRSSESPSRQPLVKRGSGKKLNDVNAKKMLPRSFTINVLQNVGHEKIVLENIDDSHKPADVNLACESRRLGSATVIVDVCTSQSLCASGATVKDTRPNHLDCMDLCAVDFNNALLD